MKRIAHKRWTLAAAAIAAAVLVVSVPLAVAWGITGDNGPPRSAVVQAKAVPPMVAALAKKTHVSSLHTVTADAEGRIGVFGGTGNGGTSVVAFGSADFVSGFAPIARFLQGEPLAVRATAGGPAGTSATWAGVVGMTAADVDHVQVTAADGAVHDVMLVGGTFAYSASTPTGFAVKVTAFNAQGDVLGTAEIAPPTSPES